MAVSTSMPAFAVVYFDRAGIPEVASHLTGGRSCPCCRMPVCFLTVLLSMRWQLICQGVDSVSAAGTPVSNMVTTLAGLQPAAAAPSPALVVFSQGTTQGPTPAALRQSGRKRKNAAAAKPAEALPVGDAMQEGAGDKGSPQVHQKGPAHPSDASTDSNKRKADELQQVQPTCSSVFRGPTVRSPRHNAVFHSEAATAS